MAGTEGEFEQVAVREMWPDEAYNFTPWLAKNLDLLGNEIEMKLELVQMEKAVGPMSLDILAKDVDTGDKVAIENQIEWSNTHHLGQLMTYSGGCDVRVAIWVATGFSYEYAAALDWLNRMTREGVRFYGVKVEVVRKAEESEPEPRFRKVVYPGGWDKDATLPLNQTPPHVQKHRKFFQPLVNQLRWMDFAANPVQCWDFRDKMFRSRVNQLSGYVARLSGKTVWVFLHIRTREIELTNTIYDELLAQRDEIELNIGPDLEWRWQRGDKQYFSSIGVVRGGTIDDPPEKLEEIREWMLDLLPKFKEVCDPLMAEILSRGASSE